MNAFVRTLFLCLLFTAQPIIAQDGSSPQSDQTNVATEDVAAGDAGADKPDASAENAQGNTSTASAVSNDPPSPPPSIIPRGTHEVVKNVGNDGAFTYQVPFRVPDFRGLQPRLALNYNSGNRARGGSMAIIGAGWTLAGTSKIERVSRGQGSPTFNDTNDIFRLDGMELLQCQQSSPPDYPDNYIAENTNASCSSGGEYVTLRENYLKIKRNVASNLFTVTDKSGVKRTYRPVEFFMQNPPTNPSVAEQNVLRETTWLLAEVEDTQDEQNTVVYDYSVDAGNGYSYRPSSITYARLKDQNGNYTNQGYKITFGYLQRIDPMATFKTGTTILSAQYHRLKSVRITNEGDKVRAYVLEYSDSPETATSMLRRVTEYGNDYEFANGEPTNGSTLPNPYEFDYTLEQYELAEITYPTTDNNGYNLRATSWDLNNDDHDTLLIARRYLDNDVCDADEDTVLGYDLPYGIYEFDSSRNQIIETTKNAYSYYVDQWLEEKTAPGPAGITGYDNGSGVSYGLFFDNSDLQSREAQAPNGLPVGTTTWDPNDGALSVASFSNTSRSQVLSADGDIWDTNQGQFIKRPLGPFSELTGGRLIDIDGDGQTEYLRIENGQWKVHKVISSDPQVIETENIAAPLAGITALTSNMFFGDVNGDNASDFLQFIESGASSEIKVAISNGRGFEEQSSGSWLTSSDLPNSYREFGSRAFIRDVNGDQLGDLIVYTGYNGSGQQCAGGQDANPYTSGGIQIYLSTGHSFVRPTDTNAQTVGGYVAVGDYDGDGLADFASEGTTGKVTYGNGGVANMLSSVTDPLGGITTITYAPSGLDSVVQNDNIPGVNYVVSQIDRDNGNRNAASGGNTPLVNTPTIKFTYADGNYDYSVRKPLGYATKTIFLPQGSLNNGAPEIESTYLNGSYASAGALSNQVVRQGSTEFSKVENTWAIVGNGNGPYRARKTSEVSFTRYGSNMVRTRIDTSYTLYGERKSITDYGLVDSNGGDLVSDDNTTRSFDYAANTDAYIVNRPRRERFVRGDTDTFTRSEWLSAFWYYYDEEADNSEPPVVGNLTLTEQWDDNPNTSGERAILASEYDDYGNVTSSTDARGNTWSYQYDATKELFRRIEELPINDPDTSLPQRTVTNWNQRCQAPSNVTDLNDNQTTFAYDVFCREDLVNYPGGQYLDTEYRNLGNPQNQYILQKRASGSAVPNMDEYRERTYFDGFGQTYLSSVTGSTSADTDMRTTVSAFDNLGNLKWQSIPLTWSDATGWNYASNQQISFEYDALGRNVQTFYPDGAREDTSYQTSSYAYYDTALNYPSVRSWNALCFDNDNATICQEVLNTMDHKGNMIRERKFDVDGDDTNGGSSQNRNTRYWYDLKDQLLEIEDPGGLTWCYLYDVFGNRTHILDPDLGAWRNQSGDSTKPCREWDASNFGDGTWLLTYNLNNLLNIQTDSAGNETDFAYDALSRVTQKKVTSAESTPTVTITDYTYDENRTGYDNNVGQLTTAAISGVHVIRYDYGERGEVERERHYVNKQIGTGQFVYVIENDYYDNLQLERQKLPTDQAGEGSSSAWTPENFYYDAGDRLISVGDANGGWIENVQYDIWSNPTATRYGSTDPNVQIEDLRDYDPERGWLDRIRIRDTDGGSNLDRTVFTRSANGRIANQIMLTTEKDAWYDFSYDYSGRLLRADNTEGLTDMRRVYKYDTSSRLTSKRDGTTAANAYAYTPNNRPAHGPRDVGSDRLSYDDNGNMTDGPGGRVVEFDAENRPDSVTAGSSTTTYIYGADGSRLFRTIPNGKITLTFANIEIDDFEGPNPTVIRYITPTIRMVGNDVVFFHTDQVNSIRLITDEAGDVVKRSIYKPFGSITSSENTIDPNEDKGFLSQYFDFAAGLQYLNARYYDPELALFISPDWLMPIEPGVGTNRFGYSFNDPVNLSDPGGNTVRTDDQQYQLDTYLENSDDFGGSQLANFGYVGSSISGSGLYSGFSWNTDGSVVAHPVLLTSAKSSQGFPAGDIIIGQPPNQKPNRLGRGGLIGFLLAQILKEVQTSTWSVYYHYSTQESALAIVNSGVIVQGQNGFTYVTTAQLSPREVELVLFAGNPAYRGHGEAFVRIRGNDAFSALLTPDPGTSGLGLRHPGSIRSGRGGAEIDPAVFPNRFIGTILPD